MGISFYIKTPDAGEPTSPWAPGSPVSVTGANKGFLSLTALNNGNFMTGYGTEAGAADPLNISVFDSSGSIVGTEIQIAASGPGRMDLGTLTNGNVVIPFTDVADSNKVKFTIVGPTGSTVKAVTDVSAGRPSNFTWAPRVVPMSTGGFMILYCRTTWYFQAVVYDAAGNEVNRPAEYSDAYFYPSNFDAKETSDGGVIVTYAMTSDYDCGYLILNSSGVVTYLKEEIAGGTNGQYGPCVTILPNGNYFYAWYDDDSDGGSYAIFDKDTNGEIVSKTKMDTSDIPDSYFDLLGGIDTLSDGSVMIAAKASGVNYAVIYTAAGVYVETKAVGTAPSAESITKVLDQLNNGKVVFALPQTTLSKFSLIVGS